MSNYSDLQTFYKGLRSIVVPTAVTQLGLAGLYTQGQSGSMTPAQQAQWERTIEEALKRKQRRQFRKSITPISKEHSAVPPRQGLMWDPVKKRWTRPENVGHTVVEVQGRKRLEELEPEHTNKALLEIGQAVKAQVVWKLVEDLGGLQMRDSLNLTSLNMCLCKILNMIKVLEGNYRV